MPRRPRVRRSDAEEGGATRRRGRLIGPVTLRSVLGGGRGGDRPHRMGGTPMPAQCDPLGTRLKVAQFPPAYFPPSSRRDERAIMSRMFTSSPPPWRVLVLTSRRLAASPHPLDGRSRFGPAPPPYAITHRPERTDVMEYFRYHSHPSPRAEVLRTGPRCACRPRSPSPSSTRGSRRRRWCRGAQTRDRELRRVRHAGPQGPRRRPPQVVNGMGRDPSPAPRSRPATCRSRQGSGFDPAGAPVGPGWSARALGG